MIQPDMNTTLQQARQIRAQLQAVQQEAVASTIVGEASSSLVKVITQGSDEVTDIAVDLKVVDPEGVDGLQDLVLAAFQDVTAKAQSLVEQRMGLLSRGFGGLGGLGF